MKKHFLQFLAACRALWLGWLRLLALPWHWLAKLLGASGPDAAPRAPKNATPPAPKGTDTQARAAVVEPVPTATEPVEKAPPVPHAEAFANFKTVAAAEQALGTPPPPIAPGAPVAPTAPGRPRKSAVKPGAFTEGTFRNDAGQRDYKLYTPREKTDGLLPLVVMLHGCKQDPDDFAAGTQMNRLADEQAFLVLYPAQARSANGFGCWNWFNRHDQRRDSGEPSILAGMIHEVMAKHPVDPRRIYAAGLSAGGAMAAILTHTYPELLAAVGVHSGLPYAAAQDMITAMGVMKRGGSAKRAAAARAKVSAKPSAKPSAKITGTKAGVPLIVFHGDHDTTVHPLNGEHVVEQALEAARAAKPHDHGHPVSKAGQVPGGHAYTRTLYSDRAGHVQVEQWLVHGAGHAWSGGDTTGSFTDPLGPDASAEMLRFFLERTKD